MTVEKANVYILNAKVRKTKEGIIFAVILLYRLWNWESQELLVFPAQNEDQFRAPQSSLIFISSDVGLPEAKKTKHDMPSYFIAKCITKVVCDSSPDLSCSFCSTAVVFYVQNGHPSTVIKASDVSRTLHVQLLKQKADFLLFKVLRVDTAGMFWLCLPISELCRHLANTAPGTQHEVFLAAIWCLGLVGVALQNMMLRTILKMLQDLW